MIIRINFCFCFVVLNISQFFGFVFTATNKDDVGALNVMYTSMNKPSQLQGWKSSGGDPCKEQWKGIKCSGSAVTEIDLQGLGLSGSLGYQLTNMKDVTYFDLSKNNLNGDIPFQLPPKLEYIDLSGNVFTGSVPWSISEMSQLKTLRLYRNQLKGQLSEMFSQLSKLKELDVSYNQLSGNLPQNMKDLSSLTILHLQNNQFTGPIDVLASLPIDDLNVEDNEFTGWIPNELKGIKKLKTNGNNWSAGQAPPSPPGQKASRRPKAVGKAAPSGVVIASIVVGVLLIIGIVIALLARKRRSSRSHFFDDERPSRRSSFAPLHSKEANKDVRIQINRSIRKPLYFDSNDSFSKKPKKPLGRVHSMKHTDSTSDDLIPLDVNEFTEHATTKSYKPTQVSTYSLSELQTLTSNFATSRLLGEGSIGRVYKAKYSDGRVLAVKKIDSSFFQKDKGIVFSDVVSDISKLCHPNIAQLVGYCSEQGQNTLVYDLYLNGSLHEFLHLSDAFSRPLTWNTRVRIALGTACAIEYLHVDLSPSCVHKNIKSSNIFLDIELNPCLSDCGLASFHQRTSQNLGNGYNAPECTTPSAYTAKSDVYSLGVVMLELLTGQKPYDSTKAKHEQSLVRYASQHLHDKDALEKMVDPALHGLYPPKSVSRFADLVGSCVQSGPLYRPPISEVVESLARLVQGSGITRGDDFSSSRTDSFDY